MNALVTQAAYPVSDLERMAKAFATSRLFGVQNVEQALALCLVAQAEGRHPATAAQDYSIIQGRPSKKADAMLRDFLANGGKVRWLCLDNTKAEAVFSHPAGGEVTIDWTLERAKAAGLAGNAMYTKYPRQMLRSRVVSEGVRTVCPGATSGMYVPEEVHDIVAEDARPAPQQVTQEPPQDAEFAPVANRRKSSAQAKRDGDHTRINADIDAADLGRLQEWDENFEVWTAELPLSWLDALRDRLELRREELAGAANCAEDQAALDEAFRAAVGPAGAPALAGGDAHRPAA